jgi:DNA polymerase elongation subunit (family B)
MKFPKNLKIAFIDIETMPNIGAFWASGYDMNIGCEAIIQERFILSAQWSWNNEKEVHGALANIKKRDDSNVVKKITEVIEKADVVVGHNLRKFDLRWIAGRALLLGLKPTRSKFVRHIDTMILAKQALYLNSYKMDYICKKLDIKGKTKTSFSDWMAILNVDKNPDLAKQRAEYLLKYGKNDIIMNRKMLIKLLPHVKLTKKLEMMLYGKAVNCTECQSFKVHSNAIRVLKSGAANARFRCADCGHGFQVAEAEYKHGRH